MNAAETTNLPEFVNANEQSFTLGDLIDQLGSRTVTALGPTDPNRLVLGSEFYDPVDELTDQAGTLLIVSSGAQIHADELQTLAAQAVELGYAAIALKCFDENVPTISAISETSGMPMLRVVPRVGWRLFEALVADRLGEHQSRGDTQVDRGAEPLFTLANEIANHFGGSVAIEDLGRRIVAYSSVPGQLIDSLRTRGILAREVPESPFNEDQYRTVVRSEAPVKYPTLGDEYPRVAYAIRAGALPLGTIWAIDASGEEALTSAQNHFMRRAGGIAAAHMLEDIRFREAGQAPREDRLRTLLSGSSVIGTEFAELGIPEERGALLLAFDSGRDEHPTTLAQLKSTVQRHLVLHRSEAATVVRRGRVYSLISHAEPAELSRLVDPLLPILDRLIGTGTGSAGGTKLALPGTTHRAAGVTELREQADSLFDTAARWSETVHDRVLTNDRLRPLLLLERIRGLFTRDGTLVDTRVVSLVAEQPHIADSLLQWCEAFGNITRAAAVVGVHEKTIRYRLRRAQDRYGLTLGDPDALIAAWLQLRLELNQGVATEERRTAGRDRGAELSDDELSDDDSRVR